MDLNSNTVLGISMDLSSSKKGAGYILNRVWRTFNRVWRTFNRVWRTLNRVWRTTGKEQKMVNKYGTELF